MLPTLAPALLQTQQVVGDLFPEVILTLSSTVLKYFCPLCGSFRLFADRTAHFCSSPMGRFWLSEKDSMVDWARGILTTSMSPQ